MTLVVKSKYRLTFILDTNQMCDVLTGKVDTIEVQAMDGRSKNKLQGETLRRAVKAAERNWKGKYPFWTVE